MRPLAERRTPPRRGKCLAITIDTTTRAYRVGHLALGTLAPEAAQNRRTHVWLSLQAQTANVFFYTAKAAALADIDDIDRTAAIAAGSTETPAFANTYAPFIAAGDTQDFEFDRTEDEYIVVQGDAAGFLRIWPSSPEE
jgi:hypothetical protein